ncbi:DUF937 domain-containing protein [Mangrovimonas sp. YM274]|uniref:DUF937 domain-containing protein n=1 Tax=Mangrovimonas sp. YM274 TaxID=3070660 RepID=UPI0027DBAC67|nr:DUF937 domain-containing protein [Mangrovimonas sp. YM274]WMI67240.1 DUF937 domain-containing protein [Mangrovimonas sp. YM274]
MDGILDLFNTELGKSIINGVSQQTNQPTDKTQDILTMALPLMTQAMKNNAQSPQGAEGLLNALNNHHNNGVLDDLEGLFKGGVDQNVMTDGEKILDHVLGSKQQNVTNVLGQKSGIDAGTIANILKVAAPILMGYLAKQSRQRNVSGSSDLTDMLGGLLGGSSAHREQDFLTSILDADGDGSAIDDIAGMVLGNNKTKGGLGGMLGDILKGNT